MKPEYEGREWALYNSDCIEVLAGLPEGLIDLAIFSPPFSDLFVYSDSERDMGNCGSHDEFMEHYRYFAENLYRAMKPGRITCVHCTDLPTRKGRDGFIGLHDFGGDLIKAHQAAGFVYHARCTIWKDPVVEMQRTKALGLLYKQLKKDSAMSRVGMPDYMLFFRKDEPNPEPITHTPDDLPVDQWQELASPVWMTVRQGNVLNGRMARGQEDERDRRGRRVLFEGRQHIVSVHLRHHHIGDDEVGDLVLGDPDALEPVLRGEHVVPLAFEQIDQVVEDRRIVFYHENRRHGWLAGIWQ